jgi:hypothetical protein
VRAVSRPDAAQAHRSRLRSLPVNLAPGARPVAAEPAHVVIGGDSCPLASTARRGSWPAFPAPATGGILRPVGNSPSNSRGASSVPRRSRLRLQQEENPVARMSFWLLPPDARMSRGDGTREEPLVRLTFDVKSPPHGHPRGEAALDRYEAQRNLAIGCSAEPR